MWIKICKDDIVSVSRLDYMAAEGGGWMDADDR
jgi:hypothetical protein